MIMFYFSFYVKRENFEFLMISKFNEKPIKLLYWRTKGAILKKWR